MNPEAEPQVLGLNSVRIAAASRVGGELVERADCGSAVGAGDRSDVPATP